MTYLIIINYNNSQDTIDCLKSLEQVRTRFRIIIIDNHSTIENFKSLSEYFGNNKEAIYLSKYIDNFKFSSSFNLLLIRGEENLGFAAGNNLGIKVAQRQSDFEAVVLLNNDTIVHPDFLDEILNYRKQNKSADLIGGRIFLYEPKDVLWYDGGKLNKTITRATHINQNKRLSEISTINKPQQTQFITGCLLYISKNCLDQIGLLEESLFMYCEDIEYCIRAKKNGFSLYYIPNSIIWHKVGKSSGEKTSSFAAYWGARNRIKVAQLHLNLYAQSLTFSFFIISRVPRFLTWLVKRRPDLVKAQIKGIIDGLKNEASL